MGFSDEVLPGLEIEPVDLFLIDGGHGFPIPAIDWYYGARHLRPGGLRLRLRMNVPGTGSTPLRIALVTNERLAFGGDAANGFGTRYANVADAVTRQGHELLAISLGSTRTAESPPWPEGDRAGREYLALDWTASPSRVRAYADVARSTLLGRTRLGPARDWERAVVGALARFRPDAVIVAAPFRPSLCLLVPSAVPLIFFAEEDLSSMPAKRATTHIHRQQKMTNLRRPDVVVAIAEAERAWAARRWPRVPTVVIPHGIDVDHWTRAVEPIDDGAPVFAIGDFSHARNWEGLAAVVEEIDRRSSDAALVVGVASAKALSADGTMAQASRVRDLGRIDDPRQGYAGARIVLVPSFRVTGVKTQILQAWAAGAPVVTTTAAADSVGATDGCELLAGPTPVAVVDRLERLTTDAALATSLVDAGRQAVQSRFSLDALGAGLAEALARATGRLAP